MVAYDVHAKVLVQLKGAQVKLALHACSPTNNFNHLTQTEMASLNWKRSWCILAMLWCLPDHKGCHAGLNLWQWQQQQLKQDLRFVLPLAALSDW